MLKGIVISNKAYAFLEKRRKELKGIAEYLEVEPFKSTDAYIVDSLVEFWEWNS